MRRLGLGLALLATLGCSGADGFFAGDTGGGTAPDEPSLDCQDYCRVAMANCPDLYAQQADCETACSLWDADGSAGDTTGNTVQCRTTHAEAGTCESAGAYSSDCGGTGSPGDSGPPDTGVSRR